MGLWITLIWWHIKKDFPLKRRKLFINIFRWNLSKHLNIFLKEFQPGKLFVYSLPKIFGLYFMALRKSKSYNTIMISKMNTLQCVKGIKVMWWEALASEGRENRKRTNERVREKSQVYAVMGKYWMVLFGRFTFIFLFYGKDCFFDVNYIYSPLFSHTELCSLSFFKRGQER